jgi:hypothetical protein
MKTEIPVYPYTVENIQMIFNRLGSIGEDRTIQRFTITVDGAEIVPLNDKVAGFIDFLRYDFTMCGEVVFRIFDVEGRIIHAYKFLIDEKEYEKHYQASLEVLESEVTRLTRENRKLRRKKNVEKPDDFKVIDAGECLLLLIPKNKADLFMSEHIRTMKQGIKPFETIMRYFKRFMYKPKT